MKSSENGFKKKNLVTVNNHDFHIFSNIQYWAVFKRSFNELRTKIVIISQFKLTTRTHHNTHHETCCTWAWRMVSRNQDQICLENTKSWNINKKLEKPKSTRRRIQTAPKHSQA